MARCGVAARLEGVNPVDVGVVVVLAAGGLVGASRGMLRQMGLMAAFYASLVLAALNNDTIAAVWIAFQPRADYAVASTYAMVAITLLGTLGLLWLSREVYRTSDAPEPSGLDRLAGAGLGLVWSWAALALALALAAQLLAIGWGAGEPARREAAAQLSRSLLVGVVRVGSPWLRDAVGSWLPAAGRPPALTG